MSDDRSTHGEAEVLHEVRLLRVPVALHARANEHSAELIREMYLIAQQLRAEAGEGATEAHLPTRLVKLVEVLGEQFNHLTLEQNRQFDQAIDSGADAVDVVYYIPRAAADGATRLGAMLDEADEFCTQGRHLLTLATPPDLRRYRQWFLGEFIAQIGGRSPTPWSRFAAS
jgi:hypothetical protein